MIETTRSNGYTTETDYNSRGDGFVDPLFYEQAPEPSLGQLFGELSHNFSTLVRDELHLAQVEMSEKAKKAGQAAVYVAAGGFVAYAGFLMLLVAAIFGLSYFMWDWLAALIVGGVVTLVGVNVFKRGLDAFKNFSLAPKQTLQTLQEDTEWIKEQVK